MTTYEFNRRGASGKWALDPEHPNPDPENPTPRGPSMGRSLMDDLPDLPIFHTRCTEDQVFITTSTPLTPGQQGQLQGWINAKQQAG
jgi:hypothetical protein